MPRQFNRAVPSFGYPGQQWYYTVMMRDVTERRDAERRLQALREELHQLASSAQAARSRSRGAWPVNCTTNWGQLLTSLGLDLGALESDAPVRRQARIAGMEQVLGATVAATRRIASDLRPSILDDLGLAAAAEWLVGNFRQRTGVPCELVMTPQDLELGEPHATALYRILHESLTNVAKHAGAHQVEVRLAMDNDVVALSVRDDGCGFDLADPRKPASFGLMGLRERVYFLNGKVSIDSAPGRGTVVRAEMPLRSSQPES